MDFSRQTDLIKPELLSMQPIFILGAGSIGSYVALSLAKMGADNIKIVDFDKIETQNIPNQFYKESQVDQTKVDALASNILEFTGSAIEKDESKFHPEQLSWDDGSALGGCIFIAAADNMAARKELYEAVVERAKASPDSVKRYIDARMAGLQLEIFNIDPKEEKDRKMYEEKLFDDKDAVDQPCTARGIIYPVMTCAAIVTDTVRKAILGQATKRRHVVDYGNDIFVVVD